MSQANRRDFLKTLAGLTSGLLISYRGFSATFGSLRDKIGEPLPLRMLGKTGEQVTMLGLGGYHIGWTTERKAQETIEAALEGGIRFFDTAEQYANGGSETRYGKYLTPKYRDEIFLMTKTQAKDAESTRKDLEDTLRRLKTDQIDLWQVHSLRAPIDSERRIENGVLDVIAEAKKTGKVKYVGITGHQTPYSLERMLDKMGDDFFDTCQMPLNVIDAGVSHSFVHDIMPRLVDRNIGVLAMKTLADGRFFAKKIQNGNEKWSTNEPVIPEKLTIEEALSFVWSLPVSVLITGAENPQLIREKIAMAKRFEKLNESDRQNLVAKVSDLAEKEEVEYYKKNS